jgi:hypothetical protein
MLHNDLSVHPAVRHRASGMRLGGRAGSMGHISLVVRDDHENLVPEESARHIVPLSLVF